MSKYMDWPLLEEYEICCSPESPRRPSCETNSCKGLHLQEGVPGEWCVGKHAHLVLYNKLQGDGGRWTPIFTLERVEGRLQFPTCKINSVENLENKLGRYIDLLAEAARTKYAGYTRSARGLFLYAEVEMKAGPAKAQGRNSVYWQASIDEIVNLRRVLDMDIVPAVTWETLNMNWSEAGAHSSVVGFRGCCARSLPLIVLCGPSGSPPHFTTYLHAAREALTSAADSKKGGIVRFVLFYDEAGLGSEPNVLEKVNSETFLLMLPNPETRSCTYQYSGRPTPLSYHRIDAEQALRPRGPRGRPIIDL